MCKKMPAKDALDVWCGQGEAFGSSQGLSKLQSDQSIKPDTALMIKLLSYSEAVESEIENYANILDQRGENVFSA